LCPNIGSQKKQCEEGDDCAVHVTTLTASHHQKQVRRSVLEAEESAKQGILRRAVYFASSGETRKVAALFGDLLVIVCKSGLRAGINIKKFLTALPKITRREWIKGIRVPNITCGWLAMKPRDAELDVVLRH
jgi:hypothetical protein